MFGTIRKHQTWLWAVIITLTIISFVIFFSPYSKMNNSGRRTGNYGSINGQRVTEQQYANAYREMDLHTFIMSGGKSWLHDERSRDSRTDPQREIYQWLLLIQKQEQFGVHVSDEAAAQMAQQMVHSFERAGITSPSMFIQRVLQPNGLQVDDFERYVRHFIGVQELINSFGVSGKLITPQEARTLYEREHQELVAEAVFFSVSNYLDKVQATPEAVSQFYSNRVNLYAIPERVQVSYVAFTLTNYLPQAQTELTNLTDLVEMNYQRMGSNYFADAKTPEEAKAKIREQLFRTEELTFARKKALDFANVLFDLKPARPENLQQLAQSNGLTAAMSQPFDRDNGPKELDVAADFTKAAFSLTPDEPFGGPIIGREAVYVIGLGKQLPREIPALDQIRDRVETDYKRSQAMNMAQQAGTSFYQTLTNGLAQGKTFTNVCAEANFKAVILPPFSLTTSALPEIDNLVNLDQLKRTAFSTTPGKVTTFQPTSEGGMIVYVKGKLPLDEAKVKADLPGYVNNARRVRLQEAFEIWLRKESELGLRDTPIGQPKVPPAIGSAPTKS